MLSRKLIVSLTLCLSAAMPMQASAQFLSSRMAPSDPEERISRLAAASAPSDVGHGKPAKGSRNILKNDPYLRAAFSGVTGQ